MTYEETQYGFRWHSMQVDRACADSKKGWAMLLVTTKKHPNGVQIYVTKTGKVRVFAGGKEWKPA